MKTLSNILGLCAFVFLSISYADEGYSVSEVTTGIFYHQGVNEDATESNIGAIANVGFIIGEKCVAVIDSGGSYLEGTYLRREIKKHTDLPICYVINTHVHPDHILGNAAFKEDNPQFIGHEKLSAAIAARQEYFAKTFEKLLGKAYTGTEFIGPSMTVSVGKPITIDLGNRVLTLTAYSTSHTDNDLTVLDNATKTLWTGDLLFITRIPALDGSINGWLKTMQQLQTMDLNFVIPGHGKAGSDQSQQGLVDQIRYFTVLRTEIRKIIENLGTIDEATETVGLEEAKNWELFPLYNRRNITASFVELEWE
jgi:quinoprotein relay system zinc metallohydrolase 2